MVENASGKQYRLRQYHLVQIERGTSVSYYIHQRGQCNAAKNDIHYFHYDSKNDQKGSNSNVGAFLKYDHVAQKNSLKTDTLATVIVIIALVQELNLVDV